MVSVEHATYRTIPNNTARSWWKDPGLRRNVFHCVGICLAPFYQGYDTSLLTGMQAIPAWEKFFHSPTGKLLGIVTAALSLPGLILSFPAAWIGNKYGRLWCIRIANVLMIAGALLMAFSNNLAQFAGSRVLLGSGIAMIKPVAIALVQEIAHPRLRPTLSTMYYGYFYTGSITSAWLTVAGLYIKGNWGWRMPAIFQIAAPILSLALLMTCPESPRFMVKKGRISDAHKMLAKYHANGDEQDPLVLFELAEIEEIIKEEQTSARSSYLDFVKTWGNFRRLRVLLMLGIGSNVIGNGIVSYYLSPVLKSVGIRSALQITSINGGLAIWNLILAWTAAYFADRIGRRTLFFISNTGMFVSYIFIMGLSGGFATTGKAAVGVAVIPFLFTFYGSYDVAWTALQWAYVSEIMPYTLRVKAGAIMNFLLSLGNGVSQFVNPIALAAITWKYYAVFLAIQLLYFFLIYFWLPETKGLSLEEVSTLMDHENFRHARKAIRSEMVEKVAHEIPATELDKDAKGEITAIERV